MNYNDVYVDLFSTVLSSISLMPNLLGIAAYILTALGMYTIAKRRGLSNPWLAWVPIGNLWILGSIPDQYQQVAKNKKTNRRKILLWLYVAILVLTIIAVILFVAGIIQLVMNGHYFDPYFGYGFTNYMGAKADIAGAAVTVVAGLLLLFPLLVLIVVNAVFTFMAYYDLYASCEPKNATVYLVLTIFVSIVGAVFVFVCRDKDQGMQPPAGYQPPVPPYQPPVQFTQPSEQFYQPPVQDTAAEDNE